jgi:hypothetical protein
MYKISHPRSSRLRTRGDGVHHHGVHDPGWVRTRRVFAIGGTRVGRRRRREKGRRLRNLRHFHGVFLKNAAGSSVFSFFADSPAASPELDEQDAFHERDADTDTFSVSQKKTVPPPPPNANPELEMAWQVSGSTNPVQIERTSVDTRDTGMRKQSPRVSEQSQPLVGPTWLSIGVHRVGGKGMPGADMVVVQSSDGGLTWVFDEHHTDAYDAPKSRSFHGESVSAVKSSQSGVASRSVVSVLSDESDETEKQITTQVVSFERLVEVPFEESGMTVANVTRGQPTPVIWAFGDFGQTRMAYHGRKAGETVVTW